MPLYWDVLSRLQKKAALWKSKGVLCSWFSDTYIIYSKDDSLEEFSYVEQTARLFFQDLILKRIPVRGAITHGYLYSQLQQNVFVGPALIDAHRYAEGQDWLGLLVTPAVGKRLAGTDLALDRRSFYRPVPSHGILKCASSDPVYAFAFNNGMVGGGNPFKEALEEMKQAAPQRAKKKYDATLRFLRAHSRHTA